MPSPTAWGRERVQDLSVMGDSAAWGRSLREHSRTDGGMCARRSRNRRETGQLAAVAKHEGQRRQEADRPVTLKIRSTALEEDARG